MSATDVTQDVFELVLARPIATGAGDHDALVHLWWSAPNQGDRLVQVYVDGALVEVSTHVQQRELLLMVDRSRPHRIELLAVPVGDAQLLWQDHAAELAGWSPVVVGEASLAIVRDQRLPIDAQAAVVVDGDVLDDGALWPADEHRGGFGALFGLGPFGRDTATAPGLGLGELGMGPLGDDGAAWRWRRDDLAIGTHELSVTVEDRAGQEVAIGASAPDVTIESLPPAAASFTIDPDFTLRWTS